jgi:hypothetical protein
MRLLAAFVACSGPSHDPGSDSRSPPPGVEDSEVAGPWNKISTGVFESCGVTVDGQLGCWSPASTATAGESYPELQAPPAGVWAEVAITSFYSFEGEMYGDICALDEDGGVCCWGGSYGSSAGCSSSRMDGPFRKVIVGTVFACGLGVAGDLSCWSSAPDPQPVPLAAGVADMTTNGSNLWVLGSDWTMSAWAMHDADNPWLMYEERVFSDAEDELGLIEYADACVYEIVTGRVWCEPSPTGYDYSRLVGTVPAQSTVVEGSEHGGLCALTEAQGVVCSYSDQEVEPWLTLSDVTDLSVTSHSPMAGCVVPQSGHIECWGNQLAPTDVLWAE